MNLDFDAICRIIGQLYLESFLARTELQVLKSTQEIPADGHSSESDA